MMLPARFNRLVEPDGDCLLWTGPKAGPGYGAFHFYGESHYAHRYAWEHEHGPIPGGMVIDHVCRTRNCVNVDHLRVVTQRENLLAGDTVNAKNAAKTECAHGHLFTEENTYHWRGHRCCRRCRADAAKRLRERRR